MKKQTILIILIILAAFSFFWRACRTETLHSGHYSYKQLVRRGYKPAPFTGTVFVTYKVYQQLLTDGSKVK